MEWLPLLTEGEALAALGALLPQLLTIFNGLNLLDQSER